MLLNQYGALDGIGEFLTVLIIFVFVLAITYFSTRWIANYQKGHVFSKNIEVIETYKITPNKYLQIVKTGDKYLVIAVCKDTITFLTELTEEQIELSVGTQPVMKMNFKEILEKATDITRKKK
ncbi:MAG: flagellar biosynthetic protein FliO [Lachnospiraceae bacterium]|nr:flagellar biosynthetic protein FliO [Lachnospiraceae bacterium]